MRPLQRMRETGEWRDGKKEGPRPKRGENERNI